MVLVGEDTARLVPGASLFSAGRMTLKGVPQPVEGFFLDRPPAEDDKKKAEPEGHSSVSTHPTSIDPTPRFI